MVTSLFLRALMLVSLCMFALARNVAPYAQKDTLPRNQARHPPRQKAPSINIKGGVRHGSNGRRFNDNAAVVPESHVFYNNYRVNFSWQDPQLVAALGIPAELTPATNLFDKRSDHRLSKRAPGSSPSDPVFKLPSCLGCIQAQAGNIVSLNDLTVEWLERQMTKTDAQLRNKCVFYTSVPKIREDENEYNDRGDLGGQDKHAGLSKIASDYACRSNKYTIWHMYPGANDVTNAPEDRQVRNFWEVSTPGSWLNFLSKDDQMFTYFERMSEAMARHCGGTVYVMSMRPLRLFKYGYIWGKVEHKKLFERYSAGLGGAPTTLVSIDAADPSKQYTLDFEKQEYITSLARGDPEYLDFDEAGLVERDTCSPNLDYEPPDEDWFG